MAEAKSRPCTQSEVEATRLDELLEVTSMGEAFWLIGKSYDTLRKNLMRAGRLDLVTKLKEWKAQDAETMRYALGRQWQA